MSSVKVAVRVRPFNNREIAAESTCIIKMIGKTTGQIFTVTALKKYINLFVQQVLNVLFIFSYY